MFWICNLKQKNGVESISKNKTFFALSRHIKKLASCGMIFNKIIAIARFFGAKTDKLFLAYQYTNHLHIIRINVSSMG